MSLPQILQQLQRTNLPGNVGQIKQMMNAVRSAGNPQAMLQSMAMGNPQLRQALDMIQRSGGDPQKAFYALCEQKGVDPQQILSALK